ncbi:MAG: hypothetical protein ACOH5I_10815 [Oligoflexus sp.]
MLVNTFMQPASAFLREGYSPGLLAPTKASRLVNALVGTAAREALQNIEQEQVFGRLRQEFSELAVNEKLD